MAVETGLSVEAWTQNVHKLDSTDLRLSEPVLSQHCVSDLRLFVSIVYLMLSLVLCLQQPVG